MSKNNFFDTEYNFGYPTTFDKNEPLKTSPHYSDPTFKVDQTVFGKEERSLGYDYSDRFWEWDWDKTKESYTVADDSGFPKCSCNYYESFLSNWLGKPVEIKHIVAGVNRSNGYPYFVLGYKEK